MDQKRYITLLWFSVVIILEQSHILLNEQSAFRACMPMATLIASYLISSKCYCTKC
uniref:Uncharacterized protein n=1 Tax=Anguilla anguilla TaxID=7936 RepID=A0A0E9X7N4_ANGAN